MPRRAKRIEEKTGGDGYERVSLPEGLIALVDALVDERIYSSRQQGCVALITAGLALFEKKV